MLIMHNSAWHYKTVNLWIRTTNLFYKTHIFGIRKDTVNIMVKQISPNDLAENRSESRYISEENLISLVEKEALERYLDNNVEPYYLFKGAVVSLFFCLPFWLILFWLIAWLLISSHFLKLGEVKRSNYLLFSPR